MKKWFIILSFIVLTALTGCNKNMANDRESIYERSGNTLNVNNQRADIYNRQNGRGDKSTNFGYVRHQNSTVKGDRVSFDPAPVLDRELLADSISKNSTAIPNVNDVSTLVTDQEVLVIYDTDSDDRMKTADQVKRTAMSYVPRWYHVYVSDNTDLRKFVENFATLDSNNVNKNKGIDKVISEMKQSPQGYEMNHGEDANGEKPGEMERRNR